MAYFSTIHPPILCIPEELAVEIFRHATLHNHPYRAPPILTISWVCQRWRAIAVNTPSLWTDIDSLNLKFIRASLRRSKGLPVSVSLTMYQPGCPEPLPSVLQLLGRIQRFHVSGYYRDGSLTSETNAWITPAPTLKSMIVRYCTFPMGVFAGVAPCLEHLRLSACAGSFDSFPRLPALKSLQISDAQEPISVRQLLNKLQWSPLLSTLSLDFVLEDEEAPGLTLALPNLEHLSIEFEWTSYALNLLRHITFPATTDVQLHLSQNQEQDYKPVFEVLRGCRTPSNLSIHTLRMRVSRGEHRYYITERSPSSGQEVSTTLNFEGMLDLDIAERSLRYLNLDDLEVFDIAEVRSAPAIAPTFWEVFNTLPNLHTIEVRNFFARGFLIHLLRIHEQFVKNLHSKGTGSSRQQVRESVESLYFPALRTFLFEDRDDTNFDNVKILQRALLFRSALGRTVRRLMVIASSMLDEELVDELRKVVGELEQVVPEVNLYKMEGC